MTTRGLVASPLSRLGREDDAAQPCGSVRDVRLASYLTALLFFGLRSFEGFSLAGAVS